MLKPIQTDMLDGMLTGFTFEAVHAEAHRIKCELEQLNREYDAVKSAAEKSLATLEGIRSELCRIRCQKLVDQAVELIEKHGPLTYQAISDVLAVDPFEMKYLLCNQLVFLSLGNGIFGLVESKRGSAE